MASVNTGGDGVSLNIMPMLDIFSILILFLLMSFSKDPLNHSSPEDVVLPESTVSLEPMDDLPGVTVSKRSISVGPKQICQLTSEGEVAPEFESGVAQGAFLPLFHELEALAQERRETLANALAKVLASGENTETKPQPPLSLTLEVDRKTPIKLVKMILRSAEQADFIDFKFMLTRAGGD